MEEEKAVKEEQSPPPEVAEVAEEPPHSPKPPAAATKQQRAPRKPRVKKTPVEAPAPQVEEDPVQGNPRFFVELHATLADIRKHERQHRLSTLKIV